jgi:pimeloyl-ACP methyl ester carboxylesterase
LALVEIDGLQVAYEKAGSGPALVLLHGFFCDRSLWRAQLEDLSDEFTVVAPDLPGCGESSDPPEDFSITDFAASTISFIEQLGILRPHVLGLSLGSAIALEMYRLRPDLPAALVLASAYAGWAGSLPPDVVAQRLERTVQQTYEPPEQWVGDWIPGLITGSAPESVRRQVTVMVSAFHPVGARAMTRAGAQADLRGVLPQIRVPTLLIYGDRDVRSPLHVAHELQANIPGSKLVIIEGVGHACNVEAPEQFNAAVRQFLRAIPIYPAVRMPQ